MRRYSVLPRTARPTGVLVLPRTSNGLARATTSDLARAITSDLARATTSDLARSTTSDLARATTSLPYHGSGASGTSSLAPLPRVWCYRHELSRSPTTGLSRTCATGAILRMSSLAVLPRSARPIVLTLTFSHTRSLRPVHEPMIYVSELASFLA